MDYNYDGQLQRYLMQFMRIFVGIKWATSSGVTQTIPVMYGNLSRQVGHIIKDFSENKLHSVPKISCYISGLEYDQSRLSDSTFVSKSSVILQDSDDEDNVIEGSKVTVERLFPAPYLLTVNTEIWTSNTEQRLQILEQLLVLFNPSLELQTVDNYFDWTSLTTVYLKSSKPNTKSIPVGVNSEIDVSTLSFEIPVWISAPAKVKKSEIINKIKVSVNCTDTIFEGSFINEDDI